MEIKKAKELIRGLNWAEWTDEQKEAIRIAYNSMSAIEEIKNHCEFFDEFKTPC